MRKKPRKQKLPVKERINRYATTKYAKIASNRHVRPTAPKDRKRKRINHFLARLNQRYGYRNLKISDYGYIIKSIIWQEEHAHRICALSGPCVLYAVRFRGGLIFVVYDWDNKELCTVVPRNDPRVIEWMNMGKKQSNDKPSCAAAYQENILEYLDKATATLSKCGGPGIADNSAQIICNIDGALTLLDRIAALNADNVFVKLS
jgi:hypothetical protein